MELKTNKEFLQAAEAELEKVVTALGHQGEEISDFEDLKSIVEDEKIGTTVATSTNAIGNVSFLLAMVENDEKLLGKVIDYANGDKNKNPFTKLLEKALPVEKTVTLVAVQETVAELLDLNGAVTSLEVKALLRANGFRAYQSEVSKFLNEMYEAGQLGFVVAKIGTATFRNYKRGVVALDSLSLDEFEDETTDSEDETSTVAAVTDSNPLAFASKADRNTAIRADWANTDLSINDLAIRYNLSKRQIGRIVA